MRPSLRTDLMELLKRAQEKFDALSPEEQRAHRKAQRKSWVIGEMMLEHPEMTREQAEELYRRIEP